MMMKKQNKTVCSDDVKVVVVVSVVSVVAFVGDAHHTSPRAAATASRSRLFTLRKIV
jgi:hypothetical protein